MTLIFTGPQGCGKGTQVDLLKQKLQDVGDLVVDVQTGQIFRQLASDGSYTGSRIKELTNAGDMVPDIFTNAMWISDISKRMTAEAHLTFDGVPRTLDQALVVDQILKFYDRTSVQVISLDVPEEEVVSRMVARGREDDTPKSIRKRLSLYKVNTVPVLEHYRSVEGAAVHVINGAKDENTVHASICAALGL